MEFNKDNYIATSGARRRTRFRKTVNKQLEKVYRFLSQFKKLKNSGDANDVIMAFIDYLKEQGQLLNAKVSTIPDMARVINRRFNSFKVFTKNYIHT